MTNLSLYSNKHSYLREVGFPDNVLEARIARINILKNLSAQAQQERQLSQQEAAASIVPATQVCW